MAADLIDFEKAVWLFLKKALEDGDERCSICVLHGDAQHQQTENRRYHFLTDSTQRFNANI